MLPSVVLSARWIPKPPVFVHCRLCWLSQLFFITSGGTKRHWRVCSRSLNSLGPEDEGGVVCLGTQTKDKIKWLWLSPDSISLLHARLVVRGFPGCRRHGSAKPDPNHKVPQHLGKGTRFAGVQLVTPEGRDAQRKRHDFHVRWEKADGSREMGSNCSNYGTTNPLGFTLCKTLTPSAHLCLQSLLEALLPPYHYIYTWGRHG